MSDNSADNPFEGEIVSSTTQEPAPFPQAIKTRRGFLRLEHVEVKHIEDFLDVLADTGLKKNSAERAGLSYMTVLRLEKQDEEFKTMVHEAMESYRESLQREAHRRAVDGWDEPVFSQKLGTQIGTVRKYDSKLLELMLKRHVPEFREKFEGEIKVTGGVLVAPLAAATAEDWAAKFGGDHIQEYSTQPQLPPAEGK